MALPSVALGARVRPRRRRLALRPRHLHDRHPHIQEKGTCTTALTYTRPPHSHLLLHLSGVRFCLVTYTTPAPWPVSLSLPHASLPLFLSSLSLYNAMSCGAYE